MRKRIGSVISIGRVLISLLPSRRLTSGLSSVSNAPLSVGTISRQQIDSLLPLRSAVRLSVSACARQCFVFVVNTVISATLLPTQCMAWHFEHFLALKVPIRSHAFQLFIAFSESQTLIHSFEHKYNIQKLGIEKTSYYFLVWPIWYDEHGGMYF